MKKIKQVFCTNKNSIDEDGTIMGTVFDYILRDGGESENWKWEYYESLR